MAPRSETFNDAPAIVAAQADSGSGGSNGPRSITDFLLEPFLSSEPGSCPKNLVYDKLLQITMRNIFDPKVLGDFDSLLNKYNCDINSEEDAIKFAEEAVATLGDPFTEVLNPTELANLRKLVDGGFSGIGIAIKLSPDADPKGPLTVKRVFEGGPAEKAGLRIDDVIVKIDDVAIEADTTQSSSIEKIRGAIGTEVKITVRRGDQEIDLKVTRNQVNAPVVDERRLPDNIAYIQLTDFMQADAADEMKAALIKHQEADAYIIDLRNNTGGSVSNALQIASMFVSEGNLVTIKSRKDSDPKNPVYETSKLSVNPRDAGMRVEVRTTDGALPQVGFFEKEQDIIDKPVVILVNEFSASASEMTAAALRDNGAATIVGGKTFGKGVAQAVIVSGDAAVKVTHSRYYTPKDVWLGDGHDERIGITPDIVVDNPQGVEMGSADDVQLKRAIEFLKPKAKAG